MSTRLMYLLGFVLICVLLATSVYLEFVEGIMPCPLCVLQRICFALWGLFFLLGIFLHRR
jgi:disulfide bond formation protein DsbB